MDLLRASDPMKFRLKRAGDHYDLYIDEYHVMHLAEYSEIVSKSQPTTYDQVLVGEVLAVLGETSEFYDILPLYPRFFSERAYNDLKSTFKRSRREGEAKALALAKRLYLDEFNRMMQPGTWVKIPNGSSGVLEIKLSKEKSGYCYWLRFRDGIDSITVKHDALLSEYFALFWCLRTGRTKELKSALSNIRHGEINSSVQDVEDGTLLEALKLVLRHDTTLGAALFLVARD